MELNSGHRLDLRGISCPMNFVRIKLELDRLGPGVELKVLADGGETGLDILRSLEQQGFAVAAIRQEEDALAFIVSGRHA